MKKRDATGIYVWNVLMKAHHGLREVALRSIENTGMCFSDFAVLEALLHKGPMAVNTIGAKVHLTSGSITTAVDRLESRGLVVRQNDASDRRTRIVVLTDEGRKQIESMFRAHEADMNRAMDVIPASERMELIVLLKKLGRAVQEDTADRVEESAPL
ncbi:MAG TPA: MarR family transcriptional regulator [Bryobacteraceae bacterium]|jgi:MarR family 2-MHQ and catechol resistance regulon transcriptional repressor|nr:MarR family transcriptional regulator [Bryobacteraceae bacterium]